MGRVHENRNIQLNTLLNERELNRIVHGILMIELNSHEPELFDASLRFGKRLFLIAGIYKCHSVDFPGIHLRCLINQIVRRDKPLRRAVFVIGNRERADNSVKTDSFHIFENLKLAVGK